MVKKAVKRGIVSVLESCPSCFLEALQIVEVSKKGSCLFKQVYILEISNRGVQIREMSILGSISIPLGEGSYKAFDCFDLLLVITDSIPRAFRYNPFTWLLLLGCYQYSTICHWR